MVRRIAERRVRGVFAALSRSDWDAVLAGLAPAVDHGFPGTSAVGGSRRGPAAVRRWLERLGRLFPGHDFVVLDVATSGPPWRLRVAVRWTATLTPAAGEPYTNDGAHWIEVRRGRVTSFHAFLDTARIERACAAMAAAGVAEAAAPPAT